ncbi:hypothetical protein ABIF97_003591 [Bradyrhizobium japonicum]
MKGDKTWFNYVFLSTVGEDIKDDGSRVFLTLPIERGPGLAPLELAIIGEAEKLEMIRIKTPQTDGDLTLEEQHQIGNITDHVLAVLRLSDPELHRAYFAGKPINVGCFAADNGAPALSLRITQFAEPVKFDPIGLRSVLAATSSLRVHMSLLSEAGHYTTPLPFKFLCYYKILELELRSKKKWNGLIEYLAAYETEFKSLELGMPTLVAFIHSYRDKCAHIKIGSEDELGLVGMGSKDAALVTKFLPLFNKLVVDLLNEKHGPRVTFSSTAEDGLSPMPADEIPAAVRANLSKVQIPGRLTKWIAACRNGLAGICGAR